MQFVDRIDARVRDSLSIDQTMWAKVVDLAGSLATNLLVAALILTATIWAARWLSTMVKRAIGRLHARHGSTDTTLQAFAGSVVRYAVTIIGLVAILQQLGVKATSILAVLGAASLAIGLAMQGTLSNVAAGVMLLLLRPYRIGETVEINGRLGTVMALDIFTTELASPEGLKVIMPNGKVFGEMIVNHSSPATRRMEITIGIDYEDDVDKALQVMLDCARADTRILGTPEPWAQCTGFADSAVNVTLRAWAPMPVFWDSYHEMLGTLKKAFDAAGLSIPYPHQVQVDKHPRQATVTLEPAPDPRSDPSNPQSPPKA